MQDCEPPAFLEDSVLAEIRLGNTATEQEAFDNLGAEWIWLSMRILTPWLYPAGRSRGWPLQMAISAERSC